MRGGQFATTGRGSPTSLVIVEPAGAGRRVGGMRAEIGSGGPWGTGVPPVAPNSNPGGGWRARAACRRYDPEWWFATGDAETRHRAQAICRTSCPVRARCAAWALERAVEYGIYGGITARERNTMLRQAGVRRRVQPDRVTVKRIRSRAV